MSRHLVNNIATGALVNKYVLLFRFQHLSNTISIRNSYTKDAPSESEILKEETEIDFQYEE